MKGGTTTIQDGTFTGNEAGDSGGAIYVNDSTLKLYGGTFTGNSAQLDGGGILVGKDGGINIAESSTCVLKGGNVSGNKAEYGGGVYAHGAFKMEGGFISNNEATDTAGGIYVGEEGALKAAGGTISGNTAKDAGGIYNSGSRNVKLSKVNILMNTTTKEGGGFNNKDGVATLTDCVIRGNTAKGNGGDIWNQEDSSVTLTNCVIEGNTCEGQGGGVYNTVDGTLTIKGGVITGNIADTDGDAIYTEGKVGISDGEIKGNTAQYCGGGVRLADGSVTGGTITGNVATKNHGGGFYIGVFTGTYHDDYILNLYGGSITRNRAGMEGGGIQCTSKGTVNVQGAPVVRDNTAPTGANLLLQSDGRLEVTGSLAEDAKLDVTAQNTDKVLTNGLAQNGSLDSFTYNNGNTKPGLKDGELFIDVTVNADVWVSDWKGLQDAMKNATNGQVIALFEDSGTIGGGAHDAQTQYRYIDEQMKTASATSTCA